ncbi:MAG TPA: nickel-dependent hydrogenase large subunit [Casimicrobiaceae bacterium]|nr:nickel-dependent hydrogenase large subunit [Casimicrobiaceae bacterium]
MTIEGELAVRLDCCGRRVRRVTVRSTRPFVAAHVLQGRAPDDAVAIVPRLFSVCGRAQEAAAAGALAVARGSTQPAEAKAARAREVRLETIQEYLRRILIDWPEAMGRAPATAPVAAALRSVARASREAADCALARELADIAAHHVYGAAPDEWLAQDTVDAWAEHGRTLPAKLLAALLREAPTLGRSDVSLMPAAGREALTAAVVPALRADAAFGAAPVWDGAPVETGALARKRDHPLVASLVARFGHAVPARMTARLVELAVLLGDLAAPDYAAAEIETFALADGEGLAAVQTARGLLLHRARVRDGRVADYQIVAPTEWNFHPDGPLARGLPGMAADDEDTLARRARLAVQALDPCVACTIEVTHA